MMTIKLSLKNIRKLALTVFLLLVAGCIGYRIGLTKPFLSHEGGNKDLSLFWLVWGELEEKYLDRQAIDQQKMINGAISGMVSSLGDPYTVFLPPKDNKIIKDDLSGEFGGVGIQLGYKDGVLAVIAPLEGTPAEEVGVKSGDLILKIKDDKREIDQSTEKVSLPEAVRLIRGEEGTPVILTLAREGEEKPFEVSIVRGKIAVPALKSEWKEKDGKRFAYVRLFQFTDQMNKEWISWVNNINREKNNPNFGGVILDLRNNPGGYLQGSVFVAGEFLPKGKVVVWQENYRGKKTKFAVDKQGLLLNVPLIVLVNQGSASASEILAGALKDYHRAKIVGTKTFGKGIVQEPEDLPGGAGLHITIARWLLPKGGSINKEGIEPDVVVESSNDEKEDLILEKGMDILVKGNNDEEK